MEDLTLFIISVLASIGLAVILFFIVVFIYVSLTGR